MDVYKEWFKGFEIEDFDALLIQCPIEISKNFNKEEGLIRTPIQYNEEEGSVTFTGEIPQGKSLRMMRADIDEMVDASSQAVKDSLSKMEDESDDGKIVNLLISCSGRKALLGSETEDELFDSNKISKDKNSKQVGFYSYGEFTSVNDRSEFVNQTMTVISIKEKKVA